VAQGEIEGDARPEGAALTRAAEAPEPDTGDALPHPPGDLPAPEPHGLADGVERHLDPRSVELGRAQGLIAAGITSASLLPAPVIALFVSGPGRAATVALAAGWCAVTLMLSWFALRWPAVAHRHASYTLRPLGIEIRRGVIWRTVVTVPRSRVQHTDVAQGPVERRYGLGRLIIYTAGSSHAQVTLHGLNHDVALRIRDFLLPREGGDAL